VELGEGGARIVRGTMQTGRFCGDVQERDGARGIRERSKNEWGGQALRKGKKPLGRE